MRRIPTASRSGDVGYAIDTLLLFLREPFVGMKFLYGYPLLRSDGMLIFGASFPYDPVPGSYLIGVKTPSPGMAVAPWPRIRHDNQNSGNLSTKLP